MPQEFKRSPSIEKKISEIMDSDIRVSVIGTVIEAADQLIILDDGTGKIRFVFDEPPAVASGQLVRAIGRVMPSQKGIEIHGEIVQNMEKLDLDVFKKLSSIK